MLNSKFKIKLLCADKPFMKYNDSALPKLALRNLTLILSFAVFSSIAISSIAKAEMAGIFMMIKGQVTLKIKGSNPLPAKIGTKLHESDQVTSGPDSRAKIVMEDGNVLNISPDTIMTVEKYRNDANEKNVEIKIDQGKLRSSVEQKYDGVKSQFNIRTPTSVAGVRGTDFITSYNPASHVAQFVTFHGVVTVSQITNGQYSKPVEVKGGQMTSVNPNASAPEVPKAVPPTQLQQMNTQSSTESASNKPHLNGSREIASTGPVNEPGLASGPNTASEPKPQINNMIGTQDLSPDTAKNLNLPPPPTGTSVMSPPPFAKPPLPPSSTLLQNTVGGAGKAKINIILTPQ